jgi:hypothetical protein
MIAHTSDLLIDHEIVMANTEPNVTPDLTISVLASITSTPSLFHYLVVFACQLIRSANRRNCEYLRVRGASYIVEYKSSLVWIDETSRVLSDPSVLFDSCPVRLLSCSIAIATAPSALQLTVLMEHLATLNSTWYCAVLLGFTPC